MFPRNDKHKLLLVFGLVFLASFSWTQAKKLEIELPEAEDLEPSEVQELKISKVEDLQLSRAKKIEVLEPIKTEGLKPSEILRLARLRGTKAPKEKELETPKEEKVKSSNKQESKLPLAEFCIPELCTAPDCRCSAIPELSDEYFGLEKRIPQFITVTFDDGVNYMNYAQYEELFEGLRNPDNCSIRSTFFVTHEYTDYSKINSLYRKGHEIALHSVTHGTGTNYWRDADEDLMTLEFENQIEMLENFAYVDRKNIRGMRLPFLQMSGNTSYIVGKKLGLLYDSSWPTQQYADPPMWPYTLDYLSLQECPIGPCPTASIPGFWVNPMVTWADLEGHSCAMMDACVNIPKDDADEIFYWMLENFNKHYETNRAPFGMYLHAAIFNRHDNYIKGFRKFLEYALTLDDVYMTTMSHVIEYMQHPHLGKPFKGGCPKPPQTKKCIPNSCTLEKGSTSDMRYMTICGKCPEVYPWLNNPLGLRNNSDEKYKSE